MRIESVQDVANIILKYNNWNVSNEWRFYSNIFNDEYYIHFWCMNFPGFTVEGEIIKLNEPIKNPEEGDNAFYYNAIKNGKSLFRWDSPSFIKNNRIEFNFSHKLSWLKNYRLGRKLKKIGVKFY